MKLPVKAKEYINKYRSEIVVGLIVSLIWFLIEWVAKVVPSTGKTILGSLINLIYSSAAEIDSSHILLCIVMVFLGKMLSDVVTLFISSHLDKKYNKEIKEYEKELDKAATEIKKLYLEINELKKESPQDESKINDLQIRIEEYKDSILNEEVDTEKTSYKRIWLLVVIILLYSFIYLIMIRPLMILNDFNRDIKMIKPYTDSKTITMLESDWTRMQSKDDYDSIYETINRIKDDNNLPE